MSSTASGPPNPELPAPSGPVPPPRRRRVGARYAIFALLLLPLIAATVFYYLTRVAPFETTDDAFLDGYVTYVSPRVSGLVTRLLVVDNQRVKAGDVLLEIDPHDFETETAQAEAQLAAASNRVAQAEAQIIVDDAKAAQQRAAIAAAEALASRAEADRRRYAAVPSQAVSRTQFDLANTQATSAEADLQVARQAARAAEALLPLDRVNVQTAKTEIQRAQASLDLARLELSYTRVLAPRDGWVTHRTVEQGAYVQTGQALLALVPEEVWVVANFKETQLTHMRAGQPATIHIDAYPGREFRGRVDSLQAGSGARFSLLPPENAVGNFVKVVQRVPVKIVFDQPMQWSNMDLAPGLSVEPKVRVQ